MIENGFYIFREPPNEALELVKLYQNANPSSWPDRGKKFLRLDKNLDMQNLPKPFLDLAISMHGVAKHYLGDSAKLYSVNVSYAHPTTEEWSSSQMYHCDWRDSNTLKIFVYLNDVGQEQGPFMFIDSYNSAIIRDRLNYENDKSHRVDDETIYGIYNTPNIILGQAGTTFMVDTCACFHCGGRVTSGGRLMAMLQFLRPGHKKEMKSIII